MAVNWTIDISDLLVLGAALFAVLRVTISQRDIVRDVASAAKALREDVDRIDGRVNTHHEWLIGAGLDQRSGRERRQHG